MQNYHREACVNWTMNKQTSCIHRAILANLSTRYSIIETKEAARIGYNGLLFPHEYSVLKQQTLNALSFVLWFNKGLRRTQHDTTATNR